MASPAQVVLYDDSCPMCTFQMRVLTWLDWRDAVRLIPLSSAESRERAPQLTPEELREAIHCVSPDGRVYRGARAFRHLGFQIPALIPLALVLWIPGVIWIAEKIYMAVSRNRQLLSRWFGCGAACSYLPARNQDVALRDSDDDSVRHGG